LLGIHITQNLCGYVSNARKSLITTECWMNHWWKGTYERFQETDICRSKLC